MKFQCESARMSSSSCPTNTGSNNESVEGGNSPRTESEETETRETIENLLREANGGSTDAMCQLGLCYYDGKGVARDFKTACEWYLKAARNGNDKAMNLIGLCYERGEGVIKSKAEAFEWFFRAAEKGNADAMFNVGLFLIDTAGVQYKKSAFEWFLKSANLGNAYGMHGVGCCYETGEGVKQDSEKAYECYLKAVEKGVPDAQFRVGHYNKRDKRFYETWQMH